MIFGNFGIKKFNETCFDRRFAVGADPRGGQLLELLRHPPVLEEAAGRGAAAPARPGRRAAPAQRRQSRGGRPVGC